VLQASLASIRVLLQNVFTNVMVRTNTNEDPAKLHSLSSAFEEIRDAYSKLENVMDINVLRRNILEEWQDTLKKVAESSLRILKTASYQRPVILKKDFKRESLAGYLFKRGLQW
jgi:hypothetical protein